MRASGGRGASARAATIRRPFLLAGVLLSGIVVTGCNVIGSGTSSPPNLPSAAVGRPGEEVRIRGQVLENRNMMPVDGLGVLRIVLNHEQLEVVYGYGEWPACHNERATIQGMSAARGKWVEVFGLVGEGGEVKTCGSEAYYIRRI